MGDSRKKIEKWRDLGIIRKDDAKTAIDRIEKRLKEQGNSLDEKISNIEKARSSNHLKIRFTTTDLNKGFNPVFF
ncbi:hypothetical protein [Dokdonia sp.]|uniref:hypothetical protein n=1 Tax=Dokdonia sp. TaxID=2024995 RepID=UPI0032668D3C